ncbi:uncharacterized protein LOC117189345 isoform X2 [Drosophila miranda]|uniref:uncharacterized protein LOC117189345 isoform X2 n=1 Tax=Drosophila miranda TaxID=7229 RepID=UPI00143F7C0D|nr:uncharacterized protein LOC117189345 isoform X2 [Drosophila miranda]
MYKISIFYEACSQKIDCFPCWVAGNMAIQILSDSYAYLHNCFMRLYYKIIGSILFERLLSWLKICLTYFLICCTSVWSTLKRWQNYFGYFCWLMYHWTAFWSRRVVRRYLYQSDLAVWQKIYGMPDTGQVVLFNGWHKASRVVCDDCRMNRVGKLIDQAKVCLDVVLLSTANVKYIDRILAAHIRGVTVRVLASDKMLAANGPAMKLLCALSVQVRCYSIGVIFGYNFAIIDSEKRALEIEAKQDTVHTCLWRLRGNMKGCLNWILLAALQKRDYRNDNRHYQKFFDEWNFLYPVTPSYFIAYNLPSPQHKA